MEKKRIRTLEKMSRAERKEICESIDVLVQTLASRMSICEEAIGAVAFYRTQKHPRWGRNASAAQKKAAFEHWKGKCQKCGGDVSFADAKFHHLKRGIADQHGPGNLVPEHTHCHDAEHMVKHGSLSKGAPVKKSR